MQMHRNTPGNHLALFAALLTLALAIALTSNAQTSPQTQSKFEYEVASIKPDLSNNGNSSTNNPSDGFVATNATLATLIQSAYGILNFQLVGGPDWINSERYVVDAKMDAETADALQKLNLEDRLLARHQMLQALLADRLKLTTHRETRDLPVYFLVIAKNGSKLHQAKSGDAYENGLKSRGGTMGQGMSSNSNRFTTSITDQGMPIASLLPLLGRPLGRPVLDKTGLTGNFDFTLKFAVERPSPDATMNGGPIPDADAPFLLEAIQQQLGLKLESGKGPVEVIVIDHIERPSGN
jgi:uncharacterized protein (TIGR03435 family)